MGKSYGGNSLCMDIKCEMTQQEINNIKESDTIDIKNTMTEKEILELIDELKTFNDKEHSPELYNQYYQIAKKVFHGDTSTIISPYFTNSLNLIRGRKNNCDKLFHNIGDLWHPPKEHTTNQRFNYPKLPIYYASNDLTTAMLELRPKEGEIYTTLELELDCPELRCVQLVVEKLGSVLEEMEPIKRTAYQFLIDEARKPVLSGQTQGYYATQIYAQSLIESSPESIDAFAYNSVATIGKGYNFAIKPDFIEKHYIFKEARVMRIVNYKSKEDFKVQCLYKSNSITNFGRINYQDANLCFGHHISLSKYSHDEIQNT